MRKLAGVLIIVTSLFTGYVVLENVQKPPDEVSLVHSAILGEYFYGLDKGKVHSRSINFNITTLQEASALGSYTTSETEIDLIEVATTFAGIAHVSTPRVKIVGTLIKPQGDDAIVVVKLDSSISSLGDLKGKTVGVDDLALTPTVLLKELLKQNYNVNYDEVTYIAKPLATLVGLLDRGDADAVVVYAAFAYLARAQKDNYRVLSNIFEETKPLIGDLPVAAVLVTNRTNLDERKEILQRSLELIRRSFAYGSEHKDGISQAMATRLGLQPEIYAISFYNVVPTDIHLNKEDKENILKLLSIAQQQGLIARETTEDIFFDIR